MPAVCVVIPVRDGSELLGPCLDTVMPEVHGLGARLVVVDDASDDDSAAIAAGAGADVIALPRPVGPYAARNIGWRSSPADVYVFTDMRCRARPGWLGNVAGAACAPDVSVAAGISLVSEGGGLATRAMHRLQPFDTRRAQSHAFLPWASSANLAIRRDVLQALNGFKEVRSGGDVDLCWRAQLELGGRLAVVEDGLMEWVPRGTVASCMRQWYRYGRHHPELYARFAEHGAELPVGWSGPLGILARTFASLPKMIAGGSGVQELGVELTLAAVRSAEATGRWIGRRELRSRRADG